MTRRNQILSLLTRYPCTSSRVARLAGMPDKSASSILSELYYLGAVDRRQLEPLSRSRPPYLYSIKTGRGA